MLSKGFNTSTPSNEDFLEKLTKQLGSLKISKSIKVINEESDLDNIINQFQEDRIEMVKPMVNQPLPTGSTIIIDLHLDLHLYQFYLKKILLILLCHMITNPIYEWNINEQSKY